MIIETSSELEPPDLSQVEIVENLWYRGQIWAITAHEKQGKTFVLLRILAQMLMGEQVFNRKVNKPDTVLYVSGEGNTMMYYRVKALQDYYTDKLDGLNFIRDNGNEVNPYERQKMVALCDHIETTMMLSPDIIALDTLRALGSGYSETNDNLSMFLANAKYMANRLNCLVIVVHHKSYGEAGKAKSYSGGGALGAGIDGLLTISDGLLKQVFAKDGLPIDPHRFEVTGNGLLAYAEWSNKLPDSQASEGNDTDIPDKYAKYTDDLLTMFELEGIDIPKIRIVKTLFNPNATRCTDLQSEFIEKVKELHERNNAKENTED